MSWIKILFCHFFFFLFLPPSCLLVAFLSTVFKSIVFYLNQKASWGLAILFAFCCARGSKKKSKSFSFDSPSLLKCSSGAKLKNSISEDHSAQWLVLVIKIASLKHRRYKRHHYCRNFKSKEAEMSFQNRCLVWVWVLFGVFLLLFLLNSNCAFLFSSFHSLEFIF